MRMLSLAAAILALASPAFAEEPYDPQINPADFSIAITNPLFSMPIGKKMIYAAKTDDGLERIEISITGEKRTVMGIETLVYFDQVFVDDKLHEMTKDYIAQDKAGNVWYFGEVVDNYEDGLFVDHKGSWIAGEGGAKPGIWVKAALVPGDAYRQEYLKGEAEDMAKVEAIGETVKVAAGTFSNCVRTMEWTPLEPDAKELKYYCPEVGTVALIENKRKGTRQELVKVENGG